MPSTPQLRQPVLFVPHGGGPCFFMDWPGRPDTWDRMATHLRGVGATLPRRPDAILAVSGHWETEHPTVTSSATPPMIFDYYGFPEHTYRLSYPAPGSPALATHVRTLLTAAGIENEDDKHRGFDHGVFIPFMLAFEKADIPIVELSLQRNMDPAEHIRIGRALQPLRDENILIVATGMSYHNLPYFMRGRPETDLDAQAFDAWLARTVEAEPDERDRALIRWIQAPAARVCHPKEEHLMPLMVAAGAAGTDRGHRDYSDVVMGKPLSGFRFSDQSSIRAN